MARIIFSYNESVTLASLEQKRNLNSFNRKLLSQLKQKRGEARKRGVSVYEEGTGIEVVVIPSLKDFKNPIKYFKWLMAGETKEGDLHDLWGRAF